MSNSSGESDALPTDRGEMHSALFAHMVMQQSNMASMLLGRAPHPQTGETVQDLEGARIFIDQLEMLEAKTKGNLTRDEERLLKQTLTGLRMAFVEAMDAAPASASSSSKEEVANGPSSQAAEPTDHSETARDATADDSRKKYVKKY